jgi:hypothetical protein
MFDTTNKPRVGRLASYTEGLQHQENLHQVRGDANGQTSIEHEAPTRVYGAVDTTDDGAFELRKSFLGADGLAEIRIRAVDGHDPSALQSGQDAMLLAFLQVVGDITGQSLGAVHFTRSADRTGLMKLAAVTAAAGFNMVISGSKVGVQTAMPQYELDLPGGQINTDTGYQIGGVDVPDWSVVSGRAQTSLNARVDGSWKSTLSDGTARIAPQTANLAECTNVDAQFLDGQQWPDDPSEPFGGVSFDAAETDIQTLALDRLGHWDVAACLVAYGLSGGNLDKDVQLKLKVVGGAQIGQTDAAQCHDADDAASLETFGGVDVTSLPSSVKCTLTVSGGSGSAVGFADGEIFALWQEP